jgi:uncharacterized membrane protein
MGILIAGLVLFIGVHFSRVAFGGVRQAAIARFGADGWKGIYTVISLIGFVLIIWGYGRARGGTEILWVAPDWARPLNWIVMAVALVLVIASQVPAGYIKRATRHPMTIGVVLWSGMHLLLNGDTAALLLFAAFLFWSAILLFAAMRRAEPMHVQAPSIRFDIISVLVGLAVWVIFFAGAHLYLFGVSPY